MPAADSPDAVIVAREIAARLEARGDEYALGGAIALGYWATPRGTIDVDLTLFLPPAKVSDCVWTLQEIGCEVAPSEAIQSLGEHGFCHASFAGVDVDVFLPSAPFYEMARERRERMDLDGQPIMIWDAESLAVFKMMFFRLKDLADVQQILAVQGAQFDRDWVRQRLVEMYGHRDPRVVQWDELAAGIPPI